jgi:hypothetical protein
MSGGRTSSKNSWAGCSSPPRPIHLSETFQFPEIETNIIVFLEELNCLCDSFCQKKIAAKKTFNTNRNLHTFASHLSCF